MERGAGCRLHPLRSSESAGLVHAKRASRADLFRRVRLRQAAASTMLHSMMKRKLNTLSLIAIFANLAIVALAAGCTSKESKKDEAAPAEEHAEHHAPEDGLVPLPKVAPDARVFFRAPEDGATVRGIPNEEGKVAVKIEMGAENIALEPAGEIKENSGHHHLIINSDPIEVGVPVPTDEKHIHYGKAQTEATLELEPGEYEIQMQFGDGAHRSYGPQLAAKIKIFVEADEE